LLFPNTCVSLVCFCKVFELFGPSAQLAKGNMKVALMQPYFFPYFPYYQLIAAVDLFLIYDDVQYIKGGWINRNRILLNGRAHYVTLPVARRNLKNFISECEFVGLARAREKVLGQLANAYRGAPFYQATLDLVREALPCDGESLAHSLSRQLSLVSRFLGIQTHIRCSSELAGNESGLRGQDRVLHICRSVGATDYINAIGGQELYESQAFEAAGLRLNYLRGRPFEYPQNNGHEFTPNLSVIDLLMFGGQARAISLVGEYDLVLPVQSHRQEQTVPANSHPAGADSLS
jgi:hypothetical protein